MTARFTSDNRIERGVWITGSSGTILFFYLLSLPGACFVDIGAFWMARSPRRAMSRTFWFKRETLRFSRDFDRALTN